MKQIFTFLAIILSLNCLAQNEIVNRQPFFLKLPVNGLNIYEEQITSKPYFVKPKKLQIYPGERLFIEVELRKDTIFSMKVVKENRAPEKTIEITFSQKVKENKHEMMMLKLSNPFKKTLECKALAYKAVQKKWSSIEIKPIKPSLVGYENWQDVIITMVLDKWTLK
jgi:hypothetical protein